MSRPSRPPTFTSDAAARSESGQIARAPLLPLLDSFSQRALALCEGLHFGNARATEVENVFRTLVAPWIRLGAGPAATPAAGWLSELGRGHAPVELAATLSPVGSEISVLFEPQGELPSPPANYSAALAMLTEAGRGFGADLARLECLGDLFLPSQQPQPCALWAAVAFAPGKRPSFKAYFKPLRGAADRARPLVEQALRRLGMSHAWAHATGTMMKRGPERDELEYLAVDLSDGPLASVDLCVRHHDWSPDDHDRETQMDGHTPRGQVAPFVRAMAGGEHLSTGTLTCASFVVGSATIPPVTTHYVPVGAYAENDAIISERVEKYLSGGALSAAPYRRALNAFIERPLEISVGAQTWAAVSWCNGVPRFTWRLAAVAGDAANSDAIPS